MRAKQIIREQLEKRLDRKYEKKRERYMLDYGLWLAEREKAAPAGEGQGLIDVKITPGQVEKAVPAGGGQGDAGEAFELLIFGKGTPAAGLREWMAAYFAAHPRAELVYADEDVRTEDGYCNPWLKPDWSPDSYLCRDYLGSVVAVRHTLLALLTDQERCEEALCHDRLVELAGGYERGCDRIGHLTEIGFHREQEWKLPGEGRPGRRLAEVSGKGEPADASGTGKKPMVSVIIPSRDNTSVLKQCLTTLCRTVRDISYEIIIVDNGSCAHTRIAVAAEAERLNDTVTGESCLREVSYLYRPMEFNFSRMCNIGAGHAKGDLLLFLNDDIEAVEYGWMEELAEKAARPWAGAAGMKLLYPCSDRIQHVGVVNIHIGPMHKLQFLRDNRSYYDGRNTGTWNVLAVTGACLMVRREVFGEAGGFSEELQVAFNDVDLCFTLYEMGYHNVVTGTKHLLHHESLSRGSDETEEKQRRLMREREVLYARHPSLEGRDPYYHPMLNCSRLDTAIRPAFEEGRIFEDKRAYVRGADLAGARRDDCLRLVIEMATADRAQGYIVVLGSDNACFSKKLLFQSMADEGTVYCTDFTEQYRRDLEENMPDQKNVGLSGFRVEFSEKLPPGEYRIGALASDRLSALKLVNWISRTLIVSP